MGVTSFAYTQYFFVNGEEKPINQDKLYDAELDFKVSVMKIGEIQ